MPNLARRQAFGAGIGIAAAAVLPGSPSRATDTERGNLPFYRARVGSAQLTIVSDGTYAFPATTAWPDPPEEALVQFLSALHQPTAEARLALNAMVVRLGERQVLIDAGDGGKFQRSSGALRENLGSAGIDTAAIDTVLLTHLHPDHFWGVTDDDGALIYPNAEYVVAEPELTFWSDPDLLARIPDAWRPIAEGTVALLAQVRDRIRVVPATAEAVPGITLVPTHGHTSGHVSVLLESEGEALLSTGDVVWDPFASFERPGWRGGFDFDGDRGVATRLALLDRAATDRLRVFGFHLPWPGFGRVARAGGAYRWIPEEWTW